eukprot:1078578-Amorphochlora_amoeboformis.AAC.2
MSSPHGDVLRFPPRPRGIPEYFPGVQWITGFPGLVMAERPSLHPEGQFVFQEEVKPLAGLVPPMAVPFHRKSTKSILRYSEAFSALVSLWILSGTNYESLSASKN